MRDIKKAYEIALVTNEIEKLKLLYLLCPEVNLITLPVNIIKNTRDTNIKEWWVERYNADKALSLVVLDDIQAINKSPEKKSIFDRDKNRLDNKITPAAQPKSEASNLDVDFELLHLQSSSLRSVDAEELLKTVRGLIELDLVIFLFDLIKFCSDRIEKPIILSGKSILHCYAEFDKINEILALITNDKYYRDKELLFKKDLQGNNFLHILAQNNKNLANNDLIKLLRYLFTERKVDFLLASNNVQGQTPLDINNSNTNRINSALVALSNLRVNKVLQQMEYVKEHQDILGQGAHSTNDIIDHTQSGTFSGAYNAAVEEVLSIKEKHAEQQATRLALVYRAMACHIVEIVQTGSPDIDENITWLSGLCDETIRNKDSLIQDLEMILKKLQFLNSKLCTSGKLLENKRILSIMREIAEFIQVSGLHQKRRLEDTDKTNLTHLTNAAIERATVKFIEDDYANMPALQSLIVNIRIADSLIQHSLEYALVGTNVDSLRLDGIVDESRYERIKTTKNFKTLQEKLTNVLSKINVECLILLEGMDEQFCFLLAEFLRGKYPTSSMNIIKDDGAIHDYALSTKMLNTDFRHFIKLIQIQLKSIEYYLSKAPYNKTGQSLKNEIGKYFIEFFFQDAHKLEDFVHKLNTALKNYFLSNDFQSISKFLQVGFYSITQIKCHNAPNTSTTLKQSVLEYWINYWQQFIISNSVNIIIGPFKQYNPPCWMKKSVINEFPNYTTKISSLFSTTGSNFPTYEFNYQATHAIFLYLCNLYALNEKVFIAAPVNYLSEQNNASKYIKRCNDVAKEKNYKTAIFLLWTDAKKCKVIIKDFSKSDIYFISYENIDEKMNNLLEEIAPNAVQRLTVQPELEHNNVKTLFLLDNLIREQHHVHVDVPRSSLGEFQKWLLCQMMNVIFMNTDKLQQVYRTQTNLIEINPYQTLQLAGSNANSPYQDLPIFHQSQQNNPVNTVTLPPPPPPFVGSYARATSNPVDRQRNCAAVRVMQPVYQVANNIANRAPAPLPPEASYPAGQHCAFFQAQHQPTQVRAYPIQHNPDPAYADTSNHVPS